MKFVFNDSSVTINMPTKEFEKVADVIVAGEHLEQDNTFVLTDEESYVLRCILSHVKYNYATRRLLHKLTSEVDALGKEDFDKVVFEVDAFGDTVINFVE